MRISWKENNTTESMDSHFMMSGADEADGYVININSKGNDVNSNGQNTGYYSIDIKFIQKC